MSGRFRPLNINRFLTFLHQKIEKNQNFRMVKISRKSNGFETIKRGIKIFLELPIVVEVVEMSEQMTRMSQLIFTRAKQAS